MGKHKAKRILRNMIGLSGIELLNKTLPIVTIPLIISSLGLEYYGEFVIFSTICILGYTVVDFGIKLTGVRDVARISENQEKLRENHKKIQSMRLFIYLFYMVGVYIYYLLNNTSQLEPLLIAVFLLSYILNSDWFFLAIEKTRDLLVPSVMVKLCQVVSIVIFVKEPGDYNNLLISYVIPTILSPLILMAKLKYGVGIPCLSFDFKNVIFEMKSRVDVFITVLLPNLWNSIPLIVVGTIYSGTEFAELSVAIKMTSIIFVFQNIISRSIFPISIKEKLSVKKIVTMNMITTAPLALACILFAHKLVEYYLNIQVDQFYFVLLSVSLLFTALTNALTIGYFLPVNADKILKRSSLISALLSVSITCILVINFKVSGLLYSLFCSRLIVLLINYYYFKTNVGKFKPSTFNK